MYNKSGMVKNGKSNMLRNYERYIDIVFLDFV